MLEQPIDAAVRGAAKVLLAGCGGGYDVLGAVPLFHELSRRGCEVHLAGLSSTSLGGLEGCIQSATVPNLYEVRPGAASLSAYCPEAWLARFLHERLGRSRSVWGLDRTGVVPLLAAYRKLVAELGIDTLILVDGGAGALFRGDESSPGCSAHDLASMAAVRQLDLPRKLLICLGLGAEGAGESAHRDVLARVAEMARARAFLGATSLHSSTEAGRLYVDAVQYIIAHQPGQEVGHVHKLVLAAMRGEHASGDVGWLSPLLPMYWSFKLDAVADTHLFLHELLGTETEGDLASAILSARHAVRGRERSVIP